MTEQSIEDYKVRQGDAYRVNVTKNLSAGGTLTLHLDNPFDSGKNIVITKVKSTMVGPFTARHPVHADYTAGTSRTAENRRHGETNPSVIDAYVDSSYSNQDFLDEEYYGKDDSTVGENSNSVGGEGEGAVGSLIEGGDFLYEILNRSGSTAYDASITIEFYETSDL